MNDENKKKQNPRTNPSDQMAGHQEKIATLSLKLSADQMYHINLAAAAFTQNMEAIRRALLATEKPLMEMKAKMIESRKSNVEMRAQIEQQASHFMKSFEQNISGIQKLLDESKKLPKRLRRSLHLLGQEGWYLDYATTLAETWEFAHALEMGDVDLAQSKLAAHYRERAHDIFEHVFTAFPHRKIILMQAFNAHKRGDYALSVPVILAQTDGICKELTGLTLFKKRGRKPETSSLVESSSVDDFRASLLYPLSIILPISTSKGSAEDSAEHLNRHEVLHGISLSYGTEINSLKAISLLYYIVSVLSPLA